MLILEPWGFAHCTDNLVGTVPASNVGTSFTAGANSTDGTAVEVLADLTHDVHYLVVGIGGISLSAANGNALLDVLVDPAGGTSWSVLADDLTCGFTDVNVSGEVAIGGIWYHFPLWIKSGSSLGVRAKTRHTANITTGRVAMYAYGGPSRPGNWWCGQGVETIGITGSSQGTDLVPGNASSWGSWTSIGSPTTARYGALQFGINGTDNNSAALGYYFEIGVGDARLPGSPAYFASVNTAEDAGRCPMSMPIFCDIPSGTQLQARSTCSGTAETWNVAFYGVY